MVVILLPFLIIITFLLLLVIVLFFFTVFDLFLELPYVGAKREMVSTIVKLAQIEKGETVVDLGSGDGRLLIAAAKKGAKAICYEINPFLIAVTLIHTKLEGLGNQVWIQRENLWKADLAVADIIFVYAKRKSMQKFEDFVYKNAQKGTRVIVNTNPFPNVKPQKALGKIFLYKI